MDGQANENLRYWTQQEDIDPAYTAKIKGKSYTGTSPKPQYVIKCLTEMFGPVGEGFGWSVLAEDWQEMGGQTIHWCRIQFWHTDRKNTFEAYGQTKAAYVSNKGGQVVDEDAPKKSLTDAIVKAAYQIGVAANIFLGRWDDQKYVDELREEYSTTPKFDSAGAKKRLLDTIERRTTTQELRELWVSEKAVMERLEAADFQEVEAAFTKRSNDLKSKEAA